METWAHSFWIAAAVRIVCSTTNLLFRDENDKFGLDDGGQQAVLRHDLYRRVNLFTALTESHGGISPCGCIQSPAMLLALRSSAT